MTNDLVPEHTELASASSKLLQDSIKDAEMKYEIVYQMVFEKFSDMDLLPQVDS